MSRQEGMKQLEGEYCRIVDTQARHPMVCIIDM